MRNRTSSGEDNDQRWVSIFGCCWEFPNALVITKRMHTHRMPNMWLTWPSYVLLFWICVLSFLPFTLYCLLFHFFVQLVKCPLDRVWEAITGSTPLDKRATKQTRPVGYFTVQRRSNWTRSWQCSNRFSNYCLFPVAYTYTLLPRSFLGLSPYHYYNCPFQGTYLATTAAASFRASQLPPWPTLMTKMTD